MMMLVAGYKTPGKQAADKASAAQADTVVADMSNRISILQIVMTLLLTAQITLSPETSKLMCARVGAFGASFLLILAVGNSLQMQGEDLHQGLLANKTGTDKAAADKAATDKGATDKAIAKKAAEDKTIAEKSATDKATADKAAANKAAADKAIAYYTAAKAAAAKAVADNTAAGKVASCIQGSRTCRQSSCRQGSSRQV